MLLNILFNDFQLRFKDRNQVGSGFGGVFGAIIIERFDVCIASRNFFNT